MRRSGWIVMTLVTRPLAWVIAAALIAAGIFLFSISTGKYETVDVGVMRSLKPIGNIQQLEQSLGESSGGGIAIDWGALAHEQFDAFVPPTGGGTRRITAEHQVSINRRLAKLALPTNVIAIQTRGWGVGQAVLERIGQVTSLERLGFLVAHDDDDPLDLAPLANLKRLQVLDLGFISTEELSLSPLSELPKLETLAIGAHQLVTRARMAEVARLPALKTLFLPDVSENQAALEALRELSKSPSLNQIRVAIPWDDPEKLAAIGVINSTIQVSSSKYRPDRIYALLGVVWSSLILSLLGMHFSGSLSLPAAQLAPGYQRAHQCTAWSLLAAVLAGLSLVVCSCGAAWLPVVGIVGLCLIVGFGENVFTQLDDGNSRSVRRLTSLFGVATFGVLGYLAYARPIVVEQYLMGGGMLLPLVFMGLAGVFVAKTAAAMNKLCRARIETGRPLVLSMRDQQRASIEIANRKLTATADDSELQQAEPFARQGKLSAVFGWIAITIAAGSMFANDLVDQLGGSPYVVMLCVVLAFWSLFVVGVKWWQRMPYLAGMMTRPPGRTRQIDKVFQGVRVDLIRLWPVAIAMVLLISHASIFSPDNVAIRLVLERIVCRQYRGDLLRNHHVGVDDSQCLGHCDPVFRRLFRNLGDLGIHIGAGIVGGHGFAELSRRAGGRRDRRACRGRNRDGQTIFSASGMGPVRLDAC